MFTAAPHPAGLQPPPAFTVTIATTWVYQGFEGKGGQGLSSVQWRNQICSLPRQQLWRLMSSRKGVCGASCLGAAVTRAKICCPHPLWRRLSPTDLETFLSAESRRFYLPAWMSWNIRGCEMLDLFQGTLGQSVCSLLICLFLPFFSRTSEASPQVVAYFTVAMATAHGKPRETKKKKKKRNPSLTFRGAAPWTSVGDFSFAKCVF